MEKIVLLPLDERPCNVKFPLMLFNTPSTMVTVPEKLGERKTPADTKALAAFLKNECADAQGLVISLDMLLYGGLLPSRLHTDALSQITARLDAVREVKLQNPQLKIFAFQCIMRCPTYSSSEEEPDYYAECGREIHALGVARHKLMADCENTQLAQEVNRLENSIPKAALDDYLNRRDINLCAAMAALELVKQGIIDFMVFPQDDAAPYGFTAMDQAKVRTVIREKSLQHKVYIYPGADELAMTLLARMRNTLDGKTPAVYIQYASVGAQFLVPSFEDRPLGETLWYHIAAAGCRKAATPETADFILAVTAPPANMHGSACQPRVNMDYDVRRSLPPFIEEICFWINAGKPVVICDNAYCNGGDLEVMQMLEARGMLMRVAGYSGWNTSANTTGTAMAQGVRYLSDGADKQCLDFLALRYVEDCGYDVLVRQQVAEKYLPALGLDYYNVREADGEAARLVHRELVNFVHTWLPAQDGHIVIDGTRLPWRRMFEPDLTVHYKP